VNYGNNDTIMIRSVIKAFKNKIGECILAAC